MAKKDFTKADGAVDRLFARAKPAKVENITNITDITKLTEDTDDTYDTNVTKQTKYTKHTNIKNKSKHYDDRGPRNQRFGLLLDSKLKNDLTHLAKVTESKSVNDLIVSILIEYIDNEKTQTILKKYRDILSQKL